MRWIGALVMGLMVAVAACAESPREKDAANGEKLPAEVTTVGELGFANRLKIPPLLRPHVGADGRKVFELDLRAGEVELLPGLRTPTWGMNGPYLGPTLRASRGDRIVVKVKNRLPASTSLHWHGMHLPARADGGPHQLIKPGTTWSPGWRIDQPAASLWYHSHLHPTTAEHVYRGLAGLFILEDRTSKKLSLPDEYGVNDIPLVIQDKRFKDDGSLDVSNGSSPTGILGDRLVVNGSYDPHLDVTTKRVRFRLLNASNARVYNLGFSDGRTFDLIATDGGFLERPHRTTRVQLSPGERAEIVAAFDPGERVILRSFEPNLGGMSSRTERLAGGDDNFDVLEIRASARLRPLPNVPARLAEGSPLRAQDAVRVRRFRLESVNLINNHSMRMNRNDEEITVGTTELWQVFNASELPHSFHVHDTQVKLVDYGGQPPPPALAGRKDTIYIPPGETVRFLVRFSDYADAATPYMFHCHILQHEDLGMMGQFVVVRPGDRADTQTEHDHYPQTK